MYEKEILAKDALNEGLLKLGVELSLIRDGKLHRVKVIRENYKYDDYTTVLTKDILSGTEYRLYPLYYDTLKITVHKKGIISGAPDMIKIMSKDIQSFVVNNKAVLYWFAAIFLIDYYIFDQKYKKKLEHIFGNIVDKVTNLIDKKDEEPAKAAEA